MRGFRARDRRRDLSEADRSLGGSMRRLAVAMGFVLLATGIAASGNAAGGRASTTPKRASGAVKLHQTRPGHVNRLSKASPSAAGKLYRSQGYLVRNQAAYERAKA